MKKLLFFTTDTCSKCKMAIPVIRQLLKQEDPEGTIVFEETRDLELAKKFNVSIVPTIVGIFEDREFIRVVDIKGVADYKEFILSVLEYGNK